MHENILQWNPWGGYWWWHRWVNGDAPKVPVYTSKFKAWRPIQQRPRDGTVVRHKTGGLRRAA
jgi:hypothetical protein